MPAEKDERELSRLLSALCDEAADPEQIEWLNAALQCDDRTRQMYLEYLALHGEIAHLLAASPRASLVDLAAVFTSPTPVEATAPPVTPPVVIRSWGSVLDWRTHPVRFYAACFALTLWMWSLWSIVLAPGERVMQAGKPPAAPPMQSVARLVRVVDAVWAPEAIAWQEGAWMLPGRRIGLDKGVVEVQFASGANVLLAGPVQFQISNANAGRLGRGRLSAQVPAAAQGFVVHSARATVTDLGTEFDVEVDDKSRLRLSVFTGRVQVTPHAASADRSPFGSRLVEAGEAVEVSEAGKLSPRSMASARLVKRPQARESTQLLAHYRLGEEDLEAQPDRLAPEEIRDHLGAQPLTRHGDPRYAIRSSRRPGFCIDFSSPGSAYQGPAPSGLADEWILDAWVRAESVEGLEMVVYHGDSSYNGYGIARSGNQWSALFGGLTLVSFGAEVVVDKWTHLTLTRSEGATRLYVDGVQHGQLNRTTYFAPRAELMIGGVPKHPQQSFRGQIDEVRLLRPASAPQP